MPLTPAESWTLLATVIGLPAVVTWILVRLNRKDDHDA